MTIREFKEKFNLSATCTAEEMYDWRYRMNTNDRKVDYFSSISLYEVVRLFNEIYLSFKVAYNKAIKTKFSEKIKFLNYNGSKIYNMDKCLVLSLYSPNKDICHLNEIMMFIVEKDTEISCFVTDYYDVKKYYKELNIDKDILKGYLNFMDENFLFLNSYKKMKNDFLFSSGDLSLFSVINGKICEEGLSTFEFKINLSSVGSNDYAEVVFNLGDNIDILYDKCKLVLDSKKINASKEVFDDLVNNCYINRDNLPNMYKDGNANKKVKSLGK